MISGHILAKVQKEKQQKKKHFAIGESCAKNNQIK
jgi:hypothetical protein